MRKAADNLLAAATVETELLLWVDRGRKAMCPQRILIYSSVPDRFWLTAVVSFTEAWRSGTIHPLSLSVCCLPNKPHQSLILPLVLYQTVFKPPLEISHLESIIGISTSISSSQLLQSMNLCYHYVVFSAFKALCLLLPSRHLNLLTSCFPFLAYWTPFARNVRHSVWNKI